MLRYSKILLTQRRCGSISSSLYSSLPIHSSSCSIGVRNIRLFDTPSNKYSSSASIHQQHDLVAVQRYYNPEILTALEKFRSGTSDSKVLRRALQVFSFILNALIYLTEKPTSCLMTECSYVVTFDAFFS